MANTALIPVFTGTLADTTVQLCDARTLHTFMQVLRDFSNWIKGRIRKYGFIEGVDFISVNLGSPDLANQKRGGDRRSIEYHLTLDMAKELSMVENNDMGKQARRYFIECEKAAGTVLPIPALATYSVQPGQTLSEEQAQTLRVMLDDAVKTLPKDQKAKFVIGGWSKLKSHFDVGYRQISAAQFHDAVSILSRHIATAGSLALPCPNQPEDNLTMVTTPPSIQNRRWLVSFDHTGREVVQPVPQDAFIANWEEITQAVQSGECRGKELIDPAVASTNTLFANTCNQPKAWGDDIARQITRATPYADLQAIAIRSSMELMLRCSGEQNKQEKLAA